MCFLFCSTDWRHSLSPGQLSGPTNLMKVRWLTSTPRQPLCPGRSRPHPPTSSPITSRNSGFPLPPLLRTAIPALPQGRCRVMGAKEVDINRAACVTVLGRRMRSTALNVMPQANRSVQCVMLREWKSAKPVRENSDYSPSSSSRWSGLTTWRTSWWSRTLVWRLMSFTQRTGRSCSRSASTWPLHCLSSQTQPLLRHLSVWLKSTKATMARPPGSCSRGRQSSWSPSLRWTTAGKVRLMSMWSMATITMSALRTTRQPAAVSSCRHTHVWSFYTVAVRTPTDIMHWPAPWILNV